MRKNAKDTHSPQKSKNELLWSVLSVAIAAGTIWAVVSQSRFFSFDSFLSYILGTSKVWLAAAVASMLCFIFFEGEAVIAVCRAFGYRVGHRQGFVYSASDIYFSAITPSASGGQPACAYFMIRDGIPGSVAAVALIANLTMYTMAILVIGLFTLFTHPRIFLYFDHLSKTLIVLGYITQSVLSVFFLMLLVKNKFLHSLCCKALHFLCKVKILRNEEEKQRKLDQYMEEYAQYAQMIKGHKKAMINVFIFNLLQRLSIISVSLFVFLASGGELVKAASIWAIQCYAVIGSNTIPIPGAMGISDYIMLDGFNNLMWVHNAVNFELLSRSLSFYVCVILCGVTTLVQYLKQKKQERKI